VISGLAELTALRTVRTRNVAHILLQKQTKDRAVVNEVIQI